MNLDTSTSFEHHLITRKEDLLRGRAGEFHLGLISAPFLAEHRVQDMAVLPGSAYIEMLVVVCEKICQRMPAVIQNIRFNNAVILTDEEVAISVQLRNEVDGTVSCEFYEGNQDTSGTAFLNPCCSIAAIDFDDTEDPTEHEKFPVQQFQSGALEQIDSSDFYQRLLSQGNKYGPEFQNISRIWLSTREALGEIWANGKQTGSKAHYLRPALLDSFTQLLSSLSDGKGRAFVLSSLAEIRIRSLEMPEHLWCHARLLPDREQDDGGFCGDVRVFDSSNTVYLELLGVKCKYLNRVAQETGDERESYEICIASTFTADPVEDSLKFWSDYFGFQSEIQIAPYGQVFQQLLDPMSLFRKNKHGVNVLLLSLEDLAKNERRLKPVLDGQELEKAFGEKARCTLPNGLEIAHLNKYETDYLYREIFLNECYLKHGIVLEDGATVVDIGANVGLFTLFVSERCRDARIYAFEPSPIAYELLKTNCRLFGLKVQTFDLGVAERKRISKFTFYKNASVFSGFHASGDEDRKAIQSVVRKMLGEGSNDDTGSLEEYTDEILRGRLDSISLECQLVSVSDILAENGIDGIDLLKIDAEKSELDILQGIRDADWQKIRQIVVEVHDASGQIVAHVKALLQQKGFDLVIDTEELLKGTGFFNIYAKRRLALKTEPKEDSEARKLNENLQLFCEALETFGQTARASTIVGVCPRSPKVASQLEKASMYAQAERRLLGRIAELPDVYTIDSHGFAGDSPVDQYFDSHTDKLAHIPYTSHLFASMGTSLARRIFSLTGGPFKVIAVDCDNTLWKGVCGEDGLHGVLVTEPYRKLQTLLASQMESGMLICLCSKNNEKDVFEVFEHRNDMVLTRQHIVAWRLNWSPKSENLRSLAAELKVGLDSFIFLDDNPVECAEIRSNCPEVLTLQLPSDESKISDFLANVWAFDHFKLSSEDKERTRMYRDNTHRETFRKTALTLKDFLDGLGLEVAFLTPPPAQISRISQLTHRTNQFNFTTTRRSESEIRKTLERRDFGCLAVEVRDRFGDYGLVGTMMYEVTPEALKVDTFLLSCRALGRGVEHCMLAKLGGLAAEMDIDFVELLYVDSGKNRPAFDFIAGVGSAYETRIPKGLLFRLPSEMLRTLKYEPTRHTEGSPESSAEKSEEGPQRLVRGRRGRDGLSGKMQEIADHLHDGCAVCERIERHRENQLSHDVSEYVAPGTDLQMELAGLWMNVLGRKKIGLTDNFFETGGTSLRAVQLIATIKKSMGVSLPIVSLFECPTIALLAAKLSAKAGGSSSLVGSQEAVSRGARRREASALRMGSR
jgi:FkbH-like protein/FkbM family methyltransferase